MDLQHLSHFARRVSIVKGRGRLFTILFSFSLLHGAFAISSFSDLSNDYNNGSNLRARAWYRKDYFKSGGTSQADYYTGKPPPEAGRTLSTYLRVLMAAVAGGRCLCPFEFQLMARRGHFGTP